MGQGYGWKGELPTFTGISANYFSALKNLFQQPRYVALANYSGIYRNFRPKQLKTVIEKSFVKGFATV